MEREHIPLAVSVWVAAGDYWFGRSGRYVRADYRFVWHTPKPSWLVPVSGPSGRERCWFHRAERVYGFAFNPGFRFRTPAPEARNNPQKWKPGKSSWKLERLSGWAYPQDGGAGGRDPTRGEGYAA